MYPYICPVCNSVCTFNLDHKYARPTIYYTCNNCNYDSRYADNASCAKQSSCIDAKDIRKEESKE